MAYKQVNGLYQVPLVDFGKQLQSRGWNIGEHSQFGGNSGGGHYSVIIGYTDDAWIVHDPNGPAKLVPGGYEESFNGASQSYSFKNFNPRFIVGGEGDGWYMDIRLPK